MITFPASTTQEPITGFLRLPQIIGDPKATPPKEAIIPVSAATWWRKVKAGEYPSAIKLSDNITVWRISDIQKLIEKIEAEGRADG